MWTVVKDGDVRALELFRRHYTYRPRRDQLSLFWWKNRNKNLICGPGEKLLLLTECGGALFVWRKFRPMNDQTGINCAVFRNESGILSSELIRSADEIAWQRWPSELRHYTYVNPRLTRRKRDPGRCFVKAGWHRLEAQTTKGLVILEIERNA